MVKLNEEDTQVIIKRLKRASGQINGIIKMMEESRDCDEIVTQLAAVNKAISKAGFSMITAGLSECYSNGQENQVDIHKLEKLFLALA